MRILLATGIFPPDVGGPATYVPSFASACVLRGHTATVIAYGNSLGRDAFSFPVVSIPRWPLPFRYALFFLACVRYGFSTDIVFAQDGFSSGIPAFFASVIIRRRLVVKIVGDAAWEYARNVGMTDDTIDLFQNRTSYPLIIKAIRFFQRAVCRHSSQVIVPSDYLKRVVIRWGVSPDMIVVIRNTAPRSLPSASFSRDHTRFFSAGRLVLWKHFDILIRAFARVSADYPRARFSIAGDGPCREMLESEIARTGMGERITLLGILPPSEMAAWYSRAGCFLLFSDYEGLSHVLLEAISYGLPVIASNAGGNSETVKHGENGILVPYGDEAALVTAMISFLRDPALIPHPGPSRSDPYSFDDQIAFTLRALS